MRMTQNQARVLMDLRLPPINRHLLHHTPSMICYPIVPSPHPPRHHHYHHHPFIIVIVPAYRLPHLARRFHPQRDQRNQCNQSQKLFINQTLKEYNPRFMHLDHPFRVLARCEVTLSTLRLRPSVPGLLSHRQAQMTLTSPKNCQSIDRVARCYVRRVRIWYQGSS